MHPVKLDFPEGSGMKVAFDDDGSDPGSVVWASSLSLRLATRGCPAHTRRGAAGPPREARSLGTRPSRPWWQPGIGTSHKPSRGCSANMPGTSALPITTRTGVQHLARSPRGASLR